MPVTSEDRPFPEAPASAGRDALIDATDRWLQAELNGAPVPPLVVVIGLGDGELLDVLERRAPATRILALEPRPETAANFLRRPISARWRESGRLVYLVDPDYAGADEAWRAFPANPDAHKLIVRPEIARDGGPAAIRAARAFKQILFGVRANADARRKFAPGYLSGTLHNIPDVVAGQDVRALADAYRGVPAIITAAGPSLDGALADLSAVAHRAVVISADTALRPLLTHGLAPQFVVAVDPQAMNARHFHQLPPCPDTWLVSEASIDPSVIAAFDRRTFWFRVSNHHPWPWLNEIGLDVGHIDVWGSVLTAAFQLAVLAGCDPIVLAGADLAFTGDHPYCRGTTYEFDWAHLAAEGTRIEQGWRSFLRVSEQISVSDVHGRETRTTPSMQSFRDWMVGRIQRSGRRVINATGAGILHGKGIEQGSLLSVLTGDRTVASPASLARRTPSSKPGAEIARRLWDVHRLVCRNGQTTAPLHTWREFCGEGFNLDQVGLALERAARTLEQPGARTSAMPTIDWATLGPAARETARHLSESVTRLRASLTRSTPPPASDDRASVDARIDEAFELLASICKAALSSDIDLAKAPAPDWLGRVPLGAMHEWPVELGRAVRLFEGMLGDCPALAGLSSDPSTTTFFTRPIVRRDTSRSAESNIAAASTRPHLAQACAFLALEWVFASAVSSQTAASRERTASWWRGLVSAIADAYVNDARQPSPDDGSGELLRLVLRTSVSSAIELPLPARSADLARAFTGVAHIDDAIVSPLAIASRAASVGIVTNRGRAGLATAPMIVPRVLTDEGIVRAVRPYATPDGAMCTVLRGAESFLVREDGTTVPGLVWPKPINGELPFGDGGAIAWSVGTNARWPDGGSGYVMYRRTCDDAPHIETLPFAPSTGIWWRDRFYFACFPFGVGSWAPGFAPEFAMPHLSLFSVQPDDGALLLGPRARTKGGAAERRLLTQGFRWIPGRDAEATAVALGSRGVTSCGASAHGWTATAHPEADSIVLANAHGTTVSLTCYYPFGLAWTGRSLLVSTADGELLLFERLSDVLESWTGGRP